MARYDLPDEAWILIQPLLLLNQQHHGPDAHGQNTV
jgi:hypothetical protein